MLTIHVWPKRLKEFLPTHPLYKSPSPSSIPAIDEAEKASVSTSRRHPITTSKAKNITDLFIATFMHNLRLPAYNTIFSDLVSMSPICY